MQLGHSLDGSRNDLRRDVNSRWALQTRWSPKAGLIALPVFLTWLEIRAVLVSTTSWWGTGVKSESGDHFTVA